METFHMCLALGPLAAYFLLLGAINLSRRPTLITGARDALALGLALSGFVIVGPMQLFLPEDAAMRFGGFVWALLIFFYSLCVTLIVLLARPRLVVYNFSAADLRPLLTELAPQLDPEASWAGNSLTLPSLDVHLTLDDFPLMHNVSLVSAGSDQDLRSWRKLEWALRGVLRQTEVSRNSRGYSLIASGLVMIATMVLRTLENPQAVAQRFAEMLQLY